MTAFIDEQGRVLGRVNLVDALCALFLIALLPVAYASVTLFRPARPTIESVSAAEPNREDRRIANGQIIRLKLKVRGAQFTPGLRAFIDDVPALGFTFETPNSADVIIGDVPFGTHDLVLYDGVQEVARVSRAVVMQPDPSTFIRIVGAFVHLDRAAAERLQLGQKFLVEEHVVAQVLAVGEVGADRHTIDLAGARIDAAVTGAWARPAVVRIACEPDPMAPRCAIGGVSVGDAKPVVVNVPGTAQALKFRIDDVAPDEEPHPATIRVQVSNAAAVNERIRSGDRDIRGAALDSRTAAVVGVSGTTDGYAVSLHAGLDRASDGWRYKGVNVAPGRSFAFEGSGYAFVGTVVSVIVDER